MNNFKRNEQEMYWFQAWLLTNEEGCVAWMAKIACEYLCMMEALRGMNKC